MEARRSIIRLQKRLLAGYERQLKAAGVEGPPALVRLKARLLRRFGRRRAEPLLDFTDLAARIRAYPVILVGDYHTLPRSQEGAGRLVSALARLGRTRLALECFTRPMDPLLSAWSHDLLSAEELARATAFETRWGFPWDGYGRLLVQAREAGAAVSGLEHSPTPADMAGRDRAMGAHLARMVREGGGGPVVALVGDLHLADEALPANLEAEGIQACRVFQNLEPLYWRMMAAGPLPPECVLDLDQGCFCILDAHPLLKVHSTLNWLDGLEAPEEEGPAEGLSARLEGLIAHLASWLCLPIGEVEPLQVHATDPLGFLEALEERGRAGPELFAALDEIRCTGIYLAPAEGLAFLSNPTINQAAEAAARYLHAWFASPLAPGAKPMQRFLRAMTGHALGWLGSLALNPERTPLPASRLAPLFEERRPERCAGEALELAAELPRLLTRGSHGRAALARLLAGGLGPRETLAAKLLGERLGAVWFQALTEDRISVQDLRAPFFHSFQDEQQAFREGAEAIHGLDLAGRLEASLSKQRAPAQPRPAPPVA